MKNLVRFGAALATVAFVFPMGIAAALPPGGANTTDTPGTSSTVSPKTLKACETLSFTINGFPAGETVYIKIDDGAVSAGDASIQGQGVVTQARIGSDGTARGSFELPCDLPDGEHWLRYLASEPIGNDGEIKGYSNKGDSIFTVRSDSSGSGGSGSGSGTSGDSGGGNSTSGTGSGSNAANSPNASTGGNTSQGTSGQGAGNSNSQTNNSAQTHDDYGSNDGDSSPVQEEGIEDEGVIRVENRSTSQGSSAGSSGGGQSSGSSRDSAQSTATQNSRRSTSTSASAATGSSRLSAQGGENIEETANVAMAANPMAPFVGAWVGGSVLVVGLAAVGAWFRVASKKLSAGES